MEYLKPKQNLFEFINMLEKKELQELQMLMAKRSKYKNFIKDNVQLLEELQQEMRKNLDMGKELEKRELYDEKVENSFYALFVLIFDQLLTNMLLKYFDINDRAVIRNVNFVLLGVIIIEIAKIVYASKKSSEATFAIDLEYLELLYDINSLEELLFYVKKDYRELTIEEKKLQQKIKCLKTIKGEIN